MQMIYTLLQCISLAKRNKIQAAKLHNGKFNYERKLEHVKHDCNVTGKENNPDKQKDRCYKLMC